MQGNTVAGTSRTVDFHNFSVEKRDPFSVKDGRFVGDDGFVVPKNFDEFHERFPEYVRRWVRRHTEASTSSEDIEDWTQDLLIHLRYLPLNSKHRDAGKEDLIQTFDPVKHFGANQARFQNYINLCLTNKFRSLYSKRRKDALSQPGNMSLDAQREWDDPRAVDDEFCHSHSVHLPKAFNASVLRKLGRTFQIQKARPPLQKRVMTQQTARETKACAVENLRHVQSTSISWNRIELYNEVWDQPLVKLSKKYGISDVRLGKVCRKLKIPHPGRGYWAKRSVGQTVEHVPLPEFKDAPVVRRMKPKNAAARLDRVSVRGQPDGTVTGTIRARADREEVKEVLRRGDGELSSRRLTWCCHIRQTASYEGRRNRRRSKDQPT